MTAKPSLKVQPMSLAHYFGQKGSLSVTDLVAPLWCEYQLQYNILGMSHLPLPLRPKQIQTPQGNTIQPDVNMTERREKVLDAGRVVHEKLEKEVYPVQISVQTVTREDEWALRILRTIIGIKTLLRYGRCRELPVYGYVNGILITGIIDEIGKGALPKHLEKYLDSAKRPVAHIENYFTSSQENKPLPVDQAHPKRKWASQDEWRKEKARQKQTTSPKKNRSQANKPPQIQPDSSQSSIASFLSGKGTPNPPDSPSEIHQHRKTPALNLFESPTRVSYDEKSPTDRFGYFVEDSKTRNTSRIPLPEDQRAARLQCMIYKRLVDGMFLGCGTVNPKRDHRASHLLQIDEFAEPFSALQMFLQVGLQVDAELSATFLEDAYELTDGLPVPLVKDPGTTTTLRDIDEILQGTLREWMSSARQGLKWNSDVDGTTSAVQERLLLTYRRRESSRTVRRDKNARVQKRVQPRRAAKNSTRPWQDGSSTGPREGQAPRDEEQEKDATFVGRDGEKSSQAQTSEDALGKPASTPSNYGNNMNTKQYEAEAQASDRNDATGTMFTAGDVLGQVRFHHQPRQLEAHLRHVLSMWKGERPLQGVTLSESWRCYHCAYYTDCEWRLWKGQELLDEAMKKRLAHATNEVTEMLAEDHDEESQNLALEDADDALWGEFADVTDALDW